MLRIVLACPTRVPFHLDSLSEGGLGGTETANIELAHALAARGHRVTLATRTSQIREREGVVNVPLDGLAQHPCDVLISSNDASVFTRTGSRKVLWLHNPLQIEKAVRRSQIGPFWRHRPDAVFVGTVAESEASRLYPFRSRTVIPHGVTKLFRQAPLGNKRGNHFVWASQKQRGLARTIACWTKHVAPSAMEPTLHVFGTRADEMDLSAEQAIRARIVFHGSTSKGELASFYASAKAMIYPGAADETFCMAAAEAQAAGLPVVTLGIGSLAERVQHGVNGLIGASYDEMGLQARRVLEDMELWTLLHQGALRDRDLLTWERSAKLWETLVSVP
jgi:glycosyltransferase involved in cell wall biosynthesis